MTQNKQPRISLWDFFKDAINKKIVEPVEKSREEDLLFGPNSRNPFQFGPSAITKIVDVPWWKLLFGDVVKHGGAKIPGKTFDPRFLGTGEPGNLRPLGRAFYTSNADEIANIYKKYASNPELTSFKVNQNSVLYPKGSLWNLMSEPEKIFYKDLGKRIADNYGVDYWTQVLSGSMSDASRQNLVKLGVDGVVDRLGNPNWYEIGLFNPEVLNKIKP